MVPAALEDEDAPAGAGQVSGDGRAARPRADDDDVWAVALWRWDRSAHGATSRMNWVAAHRAMATMSRLREIRTRENFLCAMPDRM